MADLDTLRPEVQKALDDLSYFLTGTHNHDDFYTIRAELLRLVRDNDALRSKCNVIMSGSTRHLGRAEKAEAELAALKADHAVLQELCEGTVRANLALGHVEEEWQPISTAPHEQLVLLFCPYRHSSNPQRIEVGAATWGERVGQRSNRGAHAWATHWMPLPQPPKVED